MSVLPATYVLPLKTPAPRVDLAEYLGRLAQLLEVIVVDGSDAGVRATHRRLWPAEIRHLAVDADLHYANGKVSGVITGLRHAEHDRVIVADDDVRYSDEMVLRVLERLDAADAVVPQNYFDPLPWHARWDTARTLLNRSVGHDYPGTVAVRRTALPGGYDGDVMFENLELLRTVTASGGKVVHAPDLFVRREPCDARHFRGQRVRQAYDSLAQPPRLIAELALLPAGLWSLRRLGWRGLAAPAVAAIGVAEAGRRKAGGSAVFPASTSLFAPAWLAERAVCSWLAVGARMRGGVRYGGGRLRRAATPQRLLNLRSATVAAGSAPTPDSSTAAV